MAWLMFFPSFRQVLHSVSDETIYAILMYLYFLVTVFSCVYWAVRIGAQGRGLLWIRPAPWIAIGVAVSAFFTYLALFNDLTRYAPAGGTGIFYLTSSPLVFALVYCIFFPLVTGGSLGLAIKSTIALMSKMTPDDDH